MNFFISGWAGFKEALGNIPLEWQFIVPFFDFNEEGILNFLKYESGETLIGWSTGGHIILKNLTFFSERFNSIVIVAGFKKFTDYVHTKVLKRMIKKMGSEPGAVIKEFLINAGCRTLVPERINKELLIQGLEFLLTSNVLVHNNSQKVCNKLILIHGIFDKIVPVKAIYDLRAIYQEAEAYLVERPHWISFEEIDKIIKNNSF